MLLDYKEKQAILTLKLDYIQRRISKWYHRELQVIPEENHFLLYEQKNKMIKKFNSKYGFNMYQKANALNHARYKRKQRIQQKIEQLVLDGKGSFMTLTFTDNILTTTNELTRRR